MADVLFRIQPKLKGAQEVLGRWGVQPGKYVLLTLHRPSNVDDPERLRQILLALSKLEEPVLFPVHPRTRQRIREYGLSEVVKAEPFKCVQPFGYCVMLVAEANARVILTDSGGVQKEAYLLEIPCLTLRKETEWVETVEAGWNRLVGFELSDLLEIVEQQDRPDVHPGLFGDGHAAGKVVQALGASSGELWFPSSLILRNETSG